MFSQLSWKRPAPLPPLPELPLNITLPVPCGDNSILPLLSNLKANPEKDYIYWPKRTEKVEAFEDLIAEIVK